MNFSFGMQLTTIQKVSILHHNMKQPLFWEAVLFMESVHGYNYVKHSLKELPYELV